jgi:hypothetical protein
MKPILAKAAAAASLAVLFASIASAEAINPATTPQTSPAMTTQEKANVAMVLNWWREVIEAGHLELTGNYQAVDYIQHNPNVPTGQAAFVDFFKNVVRVPVKNRCGKNLSPQLVRDPAHPERQGAGALG